MVGLLGNSLPPGLAGFVTQRQLAAQDQNNQLGQVQGLLGIQQAQMQQGLLGQQLAEKQRKQAQIEGFVNSLPENVRPAAMANPELFMKEYFGSYNLRPGEVRMRGNEQVAAAPQTPQAIEVGVEGKPGVTQRVWAVPGQPGFTPIGGPKMPEILNPDVEAARARVARSGASNISVSTDKGFLGTVADRVGGQVAGATDQARAALGTISTVNNIREAMDTGKVIAGPGTSARMFIGQVGEVLGVNGKDANETLTNTRKAIQGLAQLELDAAQQMRGQGQITEAERAIIRRAASGDIDGMTGPELRVLMDTLDKTARFKIRANSANVQKLQANPGAGSMTQFMGVEEPPPYVPRRREGDKNNGPSLEDRLKKYQGG